MTVVDARMASAAENRWIRRPIIDVGLAFAWVPVFVLARRWATDTDALAELTTAVLLVSFCHQPVTLPLIYGDVRERQRRGRMLLLAPIAAVAAVYVGLTVSLVVVGLVSGLWNAHHTLRQRYGLVRVYGRKVGQDDGTHEQSMLLWWFGAALFAALSGDALVQRLSRLPVGFVNHEIVDILERLQPIAAVGAVGCGVASVLVTARWLRVERARPVRNNAKYVYLAGAASLFVLAPFDPIAVFLGFMSAHSIEYFLVVERTLPKRAVPGSTLAAISSHRIGPAVFLVLYVAGVLAAVAVLRATLPATLFLSVYLAFGVLHFVYDGMIWKLRTPAVASQFGITTTGT